MTFHIKIMYINHDLSSQNHDSLLASEGNFVNSSRAYQK